jgi:hypothetical protein
MNLIVIPAMPLALTGGVLSQLTLILPDLYQDVLVSIFILPTKALLTSIELTAEYAPLHICTSRPSLFLLTIYYTSWFIYLILPRERKIWLAHLSIALVTIVSISNTIFALSPNREENIYILPAYKGELVITIDSNNSANIYGHLPTTPYTLRDFFAEFNVQKVSSVYAISSYKDSHKNTLNWLCTNFSLNRDSIRQINMFKGNGDTTVNTYEPDETTQLRTVRAFNGYLCLWELKTENLKVHFGETKFTSALRKSLKILNTTVPPDLSIINIRSYATNKSTSIKTESRKAYGALRILHRANKTEIHGYNNCHWKKIAAEGTTLLAKH